VIYSVAVSPGRLRRAPGLGLRLAGALHGIGGRLRRRVHRLMGVLLVGCHTYAESEQTLEWFGQGPCGEKPVYGFSSRELPISGPNIRLMDASPREFVAGLDEHGVARRGLLSGPGLVASFRAAGLVTGISSASSRWCWEAGFGSSMLPDRPRTFS